MPSTVPITISHNTITPPPPTLRNRINSALLSSGAIPSIQSTLSSSLLTSGWTANLDLYILEALRSGDFGFGEKGYKALLEKILEGVGEERDEIIDYSEKGKMKIGGEAEQAVAGRRSLKFPREAVEEGVAVVRRELEKVCVVGGEDEVE